MVNQQGKMSIARQLVNLSPQAEPQVASAGGFDGQISPGHPEMSRGFNGGLCEPPVVLNCVLVLHPAFDGELQGVIVGDRHAVGGGVPLHLSLRHI